MTWNLVDITDRTGFQPAATTQTRPLGFAYNGTQRLYFRGNDNHIHELVNTNPLNPSWTHNDLTMITGALANATAYPVGYTFHTQNTAHVFYRGEDDHIYELYLDGSSWNWNDLTNAAKAPLAVPTPAGNGLCACAWESKNTQHVVYIGQDNHLNELLWNGSWQWTDLTVNATGSQVPPAAGNDPSVYVWEGNGTEHVVFQGSDDTIHELWYDSSWHHNAFSSSFPGQVTVGQTPVGYAFESNNTEHIVFNEGSGTGHIMELYYDEQWHLNDLNALTGTVRASAILSGYVWPQNTEHVVYTDGVHIRELYWNGQWLSNDLTNASGGGNPTIQPLGQQGCYVWEDTTNSWEFVVYLGTDGHIYQLYYGNVTG
jgi:hypothetical protein